MKKKFTLFLIASLILVGLTGCGKETISEDKPVSTPMAEVVETTEKKDVSEKAEEYYSFVKKDGENAYLNVTVDEFIENYNRAIVGKGDNGNTYDISLNDFEFITNNSWQGKETGYYSCPITIFGRNNGIAITLEVYDDNTIAVVQLGIKDYYVYDSNANRDVIDRFYEQFSYLMEGLGLTSDEAEDILDDLEYNENQYKNYSLYKKGLAFGFLRDKSDIGWYRIFPCTEDIAEEYGYGDVIPE